MARRHFSNTLILSLVCMIILLISYNVIAKLMLRNTPEGLTIEDINDCLKQHNFFDSKLNPEGKFHNNFKDNGNETITDRATGLTWEKDGSKKEKTFSDIVEKEMSKLNLQISMDSLLATLETAEKQQVNTKKNNTDPPKILFEKQPAVLISLDGEPNMKPVENSDLMRVINTP